MRLLLLAIGVVLVLWLLRAKTPSVKGKQSRAAGNADVQIEPMVACAHCGVHIPASEALTASSGEVFCSEEHRLRHAGS